METRKSDQITAARPPESNLLWALIGHGIREIATVPCSITSTWHGRLVAANRTDVLDLVTTSHEGNLPGLAAGLWFGTGRAALIHMQNSGLPNAGDGMITMASPDVYGIPMVALVTWRGDTPTDFSEPHQAIGRRTASLCRTIFGAGAVFGNRDGSGILEALDAAVTHARSFGPAALLLASGALSPGRSLEPPQPPPTITTGRLGELRAVKGERSLAGPLTGTAPLTRDRALKAIVNRHPDAAILFSNGFTSRAAQAVADRAGNFYNTGYMGGTLAMGWGLAVSRPDLQVVVVDGDQNAVMSCMKEHLAAHYPDNLHWYILDNGIGASVGNAASVPLSTQCHNLARVVKIKPDAPGTFRYPRVSATGVYADQADAQLPGTLTGLARGFRRWIARQTGARYDAAQA